MENETHGHLNDVVVNQDAAIPEDSGSEVETSESENYDNFDRKFAALSRKEREIRARETELAELEEKFRSMEQEPEVPLEHRLRSNPLKVLEELTIVSSQILSFDSPSRTPFFFSITSAQILGDGRHVIIKSTFSANSFGDFAVFDPFEIKSFTKLASKSITVKLNLFLSRLPASLPPTLPKPIKPIFIFSPFNFLLFYFLDHEAVEFVKLLHIVFFQLQ